MPISNHYKRVPLDQISVERPNRQRTQISTTNLEQSITRFGVLHPIIVSRDSTPYKLIAGERRYETSKKLGLPDIPCRFADELSPEEMQIVELDENLKRSDLSWQDSVRAQGRIHELYLSTNEKWTMTHTAKELGYDPSSMSKILRVFKDLDSSKIKDAPTFAAAYNFCARTDERGMEAAVELILEAGRETEGGPPDLFTAQMQALFDDLPEEIKSEATPRPPQVAAKPVQPDAILCADFIEWASTYSGPKFNFIHFDPPFGVEVFAGKQSGYETLETTYDDSEKVFWTLLEALCASRNRLMQTACHIMFWFSMDYYTEIKVAMAKHAPEFSINPFPLIWHKSDGSSILPDPRRGGRRSYETAFLMSRGDRFVVKPVANLYSAPTNKAIHPHSKPEPMLRHFFQLFVDEHTLMLDPTCGSGSSVRAAESMGAKLVLGLEKDPVFAERAGDVLRQERLKAAASKGA